jgi:uncharacterized membrane protein YeiH
MKMLVLTLDLAGTFAFALNGGMTAVKHRLDLFGILVLSLAAATFGGVTRDVLIGATPPAALSDWRYVAVSLVAGLAIFFFYSAADRVRSAVLILDAAGLAFFAVSGALKALAYGLMPFAAIMLGVLTGVGGGAARDILVAEIPGVLRAELYAVAALAGALVVVIGNSLQLPSIAVAVVGGVVCFGLRFMAIHYGWHLPRACQTDNRKFGTHTPSDRVAGETAGRDSLGSHADHAQELINQTPGARPKDE